MKKLKKGDLVRKPIYGHEKPRSYKLGIIVCEGEGYLENCYKVYWIGYGLSRDFYLNKYLEKLNKRKENITKS